MGEKKLRFCFIKTKSCNYSRATVPLFASSAKQQSDTDRSCCLCSEACRVISRNLKSGGYRKMFGGRQLERSANLHPSKILKQKNYTESCGEGGEGVSFLNWGSLPPWGGGVKISLLSYWVAAGVADNSSWELGLWLMHIKTYNIQISIMEGINVIWIIELLLRVAFEGRGNQRST